MLSAPLRLTVCASLALACAVWAVAGRAGQNTSDAASDPDAGRVLVVVNGRSITQGALEFLLLTRSVPEEQRAALSKSFLETLTDQALVRGYLDARGVKADDAEIDVHMQEIDRLIRKSGDDPAKVLQRVGFTEQTLREELSLPAAWNRHVRDVLTQERLRDYFAEHRAEFDGTQLRASQIFLRVPADADDATNDAVKSRLADIRDEIAGGHITFAEAARKYSEAPSRDKAGDVGYFPYRGKMPPDFTRVAFALEGEEVSQPFRSRFGWHLVTVTDRKPGELSLEDVRDAVFRRLSDELWDETVRAERAKATIERRITLE